MDGIDHNQFIALCQGKFDGIGRDGGSPLNLFLKPFGLCYIVEKAPLGSMVFKPPAEPADQDEGLIFLLHHTKRLFIHHVRHLRF
jgi:hypothetical protein